MRAGEDFDCAACGGRIRRGEAIDVYHGLWTHASAAECARVLTPVPSAARPYVGAAS